MMRFLFRSISYLLLLFSSYSNAQQALQDSYTVYLNYPDCSITAQVLSSPGKLHASEELDYYWCVSNKIIQTRGGYDGKLLSGAYTCFYLSYNLKEKGSFNNGLKDGEWISWYQNGMMNEKSFWKKGLRDGAYRHFNEKGELLLEAVYKKGKLHGNQIVYLNGKISEKKKYKYGIEIIGQEKTDKNSFIKKLKSLFKKNNNTVKRKTLKERLPHFKKKSKKDNQPEDDHKTENGIVQKKGR